MGYISRKAQNHNLHATQYKFCCENNRTTPNSLKTHKKTQNNAYIGSRMPNLKKKNQIFKNFSFCGKIGDRALTGGRALAPILNT